MAEGCMYPRCGLCGKGYLIPVDLGDEDTNYVKYRCTNPECNARFDLHGYELYNEEKQSWVRPEGWSEDEGQV